MLTCSSKPRVMHELLLSDVINIHNIVEHNFKDCMSAFTDEGCTYVYYGKDGKIFIAEIDNTTTFPSADVYPIGHLKDDWYLMTVRAHDYHGLLEEIKYRINRELFSTSCIYR